MRDAFEYDASYYDFVKEVSRLPAKRYCARLFAWQDYVDARALEVFGLAATRPDESHVFSFATPLGGELRAILRTDGRVADVTAYCGEGVIVDGSGWAASGARRALAEAVKLRWRDRRAVCSKT
jgi:hypothetical protein